MRSALDAVAAARRRVDGFTLLLAALSVLGAGLVLAREVTYGVRLHWDAIAYISTARHLLAGDGFIQFLDSIYYAWPPLYPLLLAALSFGVFDPYAVAGPLNAVLFGLSIFAAGCCLRGRVRNRLLLVWACAAVALSLPLAEVAYIAQSEALFIWCVALALLHSVRYFDGGKQSALIWAAVFASLALLTRYAGITLLLTMVPLLLLQQETAVRKKAGRIGLYLLISLLPVALWLLRSYLTVGEFSPVRDRAQESSWAVWQRYLEELSDWAFLSMPAGGLGVAAMALTGAAVVALAIVVAAAVIRFNFYRNGGGKGGERGRRISLCVFGGFSLVYSIFIITTLSAVQLHGDFTEYLSPGYVPLLLAAALALDGLLANDKPKGWLEVAAGRRCSKTYILKWGGVKSILLASAVSLFAVWAAYSMLLHARLIDLVNQYGGGGIESPHWVNSETLQYTRQHLTGPGLLTNAYDAMYMHTNLRNYRLISHELNRAEDELAKSAEGAYLSWADAWPREYNTADLLLPPSLEVVQELSDGFIFQHRRPENKENQPPTAAWYDGPVAGGTAADSGFDLYLSKHRLVYVKEPCAAEDLAGWFYLQIYPMDAADLPEYWRGRGQEHQGFEFGDYGAMRDGRCLAAFPLPEYGIARLEAGQRNPPENWQTPLWQATFPAYTAGRAGDWAAYYARLTDGEPAARANGFEVYLGDSELVYAKEPCTAADTAARFFRYIVPRDPSDFPEWEREQGYDWREFGFAEYGAMFDGKCLVVMPFTTLPAYHIARIVAGQHRPGVGAVWEVDFPAINGGTAGHWRRWHKRLTNGAPAAASDFQVYVGEGELLYAKAPCAAADVEATFFLHLIPQNLDDLPEWRRGHDFDNLDFEFGPNGAVFDGRCLAAVPLPEYGIARIRTGQYVPDSGAVWEVEFAVGE